MTNNSATTYIPHRNETCPCKNMFMSVHSSITHKQPQTNNPNVFQLIKG